jgi:hypothetical protein
LQMSDQVELRAGERCDSRSFALHFLHVILAEITKPASIRLENCFGSKHLRDCEETHGKRIAPRPGTG